VTVVAPGPVPAFGAELVHKDRATAVAFLGRDLLATGSADRVVRLWCPSHPQRARAEL
jgi:hypothetical protein